MLSLSVWRKVWAILPIAVLAAVSIPAAGAQNFYNVPALSFTMVVGGANPLPQVVGVASTGTQFSSASLHPLRAAAVGYRPALRAGLLRHARSRHGLRQRHYPDRRNL